MEPPISPNENSTHWIVSPGEQLLANTPDATLVVRLGMSFNALMAQHRFATTMMEATGIAAARDSFSAFAVAAALTEETLLLVNANYRRFMELARRGEAEETLFKRFGEVNSGKSPERQGFSFVRNKLTFHWDDDAVQGSLKDFAEHESVIWLESTGLTSGETVMRLSSDVLVNAIFPIPAEAQSLPPDEREKVAQEATRKRMLGMLDAMTVVSELVQHAIAGYIDEIKAEPKKK